MNRALIYIIAVVGGGLLLFALVWFAFFRAPAGTLEPGEQNFPVLNNQSNVPVDGSTLGAQNQTGQSQFVIDQSKKVFKIVEGPVAGAVLVQMTRPTTTIARYITADTGRVFEVALDSPGAIPQVVSNTTIPGLVRAEFVEGGNGVVGQYIDEGVVKTLYLGFPPSATSTGLAGAVKIQFLPDNIADFAVSPDGRSVVYTLKATSGVVGYTAKVDGTGSKRLFSLQLAQALLSWPSSGTIIAQSPAAAGVAGIAFSINATSGVVSPLLYGEGLTTSADRRLSRVLYQTTSASSRSTFLRTIQSGADTPLSFDPFPEQCVWSNIASTSATMYCFLPLQYTAPSYLDRLHLGVGAVADTIFSFNTDTGRSSIVASPDSSEDGGDAAPIATLSFSPDETYLLYITRGERTLFGVRLPR